MVIGKWDRVCIKAHASTTACKPTMPELKGGWLPVHGHGCSCLDGVKLGTSTQCAALAFVQKPYRTIAVSKQ
jgi:hypothetical protein